MTGPVRFPPFSLPPRATGRFRCALALSAACHLLFVTAMVPKPPGGRAHSGATAVMTVRLAPQPVTAGAILPEPEIPAAAPRMKRPAPVSDREAHAITADIAMRPVQDTQPLALPQVPDPTYYSARDLDAYPRPVVPLELDRIAAGHAVAGRVALALHIDEQGAVNNVAFVEPVAPDRLREELRAVLAATRFLPARKDGRAVRSRIVLSVDFAQERREP